jgi:single-strand DNA-binding protein
MAGSNINRVILTGNLTKDPELKAIPNSDTSVCALRLACNGRRKNTQTQQWEDQPNYFDITVFGAQGDNCARFLTKGRAVAVDGRLRWREWTSQEGQKRQAVDIVAETVQFLGSRDDGGNGNGFSSSARPAESDVPIDTGDFERTPVGAGTDDDIPF